MKKIIFCILTSTLASRAAQADISCDALASNSNTRHWKTTDLFGNVYAINYELLIKTDIRPDPIDAECAYVSRTYKGCVFRTADGNIQFRDIKTKEERVCGYYP